MITSLSTDLQDNSWYVKQLYKLTPYAMIELKNVTKIYNSRQTAFTALSDITLHVNQGEIMGIIGKSGAGKSTLIRCVNLLEIPTQGKVVIDGQNLLELSSRNLRIARSKIGMIFQHFNLLQSRTVYENISLPLELMGMTAKNIKKTITPLLELTDLWDKIDAYPTQLSGGQKQRVAIARALASKPHVLLSDEATSALDPETTTAILQLLQTIRDELHLTILLITHEMSVIKACCDRVGILEKGKLVEENEVGEFFSHPNSITAKTFIAASIPQNLPRTVAHYLLPLAGNNTHPVLRFWFQGRAATQPILSQLMKQFSLRMNILQANVECIKHHTLGIMIVAVEGDEENLSAAFQHLTQIGVQHEVIGHVPNDVITFS